jgi:hypothetical protein
MLSRNIGTVTTNIFIVITQKKEDANNLNFLILEWKSAKKWK